MRRLASTILSAEELAQLQSFEDAKAARATRHVTNLGQLAEAQRRRQKKGAAELRRQQIEREEVLELRRRPTGPNLPYHCFQNPALGIVRQDLEAIPDDWYRESLPEFRHRGREEGLPPVAIALREIYLWASGLRTGTVNGCRLQATPEFLAAKFGCSRTWVRACRDRLAERGLVLHFTPKRRYRNLTKKLELAATRWTTADGEVLPLTRWRSDRKFHQWVYLVGTTYLTAAGRRAANTVVRVTRGPRKGLPLYHRARAALRKALRTIARHARARFRSAGSLRVPPSSSKAVDESILYRGPFRRLSETGPPDD